MSDIETARRRVLLKRPLRRIGITIPPHIMFDEDALLDLSCQHQITPDTDTFRRYGIRWIDRDELRYRVIKPDV